MATPGNTVSCEPERQEEISLLEVWAVLVKHKKMIMAFVLIAGLSTLVFGTLVNYRRYGTVQSYVYRSERVIVSKDATLAQLQAALEDPRLTAKVIEKNELLPLLFPRLWDRNRNRWKTARPPGLQGASVALRKMLDITSEGGGATLRIVFTHADPVLARKIPGFYLGELRDFIWQPALYFSECTIVPDTIGMDRLREVLGFPGLAKNVIEKNGLLPLLYPQLWNKKTGAWKAEPPETNAAVKLIQDMVEINKDKDTLRLTFTSSDPILAGKLPGLYLRELAEFLEAASRKSVENKMGKIAKIKKLLLGQYAGERNPDFRREIAARIVAYGVQEKELQLANVSGFEIINSPSPPREKTFSGFDTLGAPSPPERVQQLRYYLLLPVLLGFVVSIFLAFVLEYAAIFKSDGRHR